MEIINETAKKALEHRKYVLLEFIESEREYVRRMQIAFEDYYLHIKSGVSENISPELKNDLLTIFSTLPEIFAFHKNIFLPALESCEDPGTIMECFLLHRTEFKTYLPFCKNKPTSDGVRVEHEKYFTSRQNELGQKLNIEDLLIAPVQRLPKYQLLIKDLLKDTRKAKLDVSKIEEALELMLKIPQETNNIICMSLIRGISRARIISHGSLWRQNPLVFSCTCSAQDCGDHVSGITGSCNIKNEQRQVYLFDHRILIAMPADRDGFYEHQMDIKTLSGRVVEDSDDSSQFSFATGNNVICSFKASNSTIRNSWVKDIKSILDSQLQMKKALVFGKSAATNVNSVRMHSISTGWSDSDSSVDSMPGSSADEDDDQEEDWPKKTGFQNVNKPTLNHTHSMLTVPNMKRPKPRNSRSFSLLPTMSKYSSKRKPECDQMLVDRPLSCIDSLSQFDQNMQRKSHALSISPRMLRGWVARKCSTHDDQVYIHFPSNSTSLFDFRSPCSTKAQNSPVSNKDILYIATEDPPAVAKPLYVPQQGQVFLAEDVSQVEVWKVKVLSGDNAGESVWVQRSCMEQYSAPISLKTWKKEYSVLNSLSNGRFSKVKLARSKSTREVHAIKVMQSSTVEDQFYRELCIGVRLKHKNLLRYYSGSQQSHTRAIAMEFVNGRVLLDYLVHKSSVSEKMVADLMRQLLEGLHYMHSHTVYHLDIRPGNVMIDLARDTLKIIDYGAARHSGSQDEVLSHNFETCYNYEYVSPEIFQQAPVGPGTDIWGVGLIMYTIFYGCTPFIGESPVRIIANITGLHYSFPDLDKPLCSHDAKQLIKKMLVLSSSARPSAEAALGHSWFTCPDLATNKIKLGQLRLFISKHS